MKLSICTPEKTVFDGEVKSVDLPGTSGPFEVLYQHAPLISTLEQGKVVCRTTKDEMMSFSIDGGVVDVAKNHIRVYLV